MMTRNEAADTARHIAENLSGYAADFHGLERSIRNGKSDASDMAYELEALIDEFEALSDEVSGTLRDLITG